MKRINRIDMPVKTMDLVKDFGITDYTAREYPCRKCGTKLKLYQKRVLYCKRCHKGFLHPRYDYKKDAII